MFVHPMLSGGDWPPHMTAVLSIFVWMDRLRSKCSVKLTLQQPARWEVSGQGRDRAGLGRQEFKKENKKIFIYLYYQVGLNIGAMIYCSSSSRPSNLFLGA